MQQVTYDVFTFDELSDDAKQSAINSLRTVNVCDDNWHDCTYEYLIELFEQIGLIDIELSFCGFWSQGDGASFSARYVYAKNSIANVKAETSASGLVEIAQVLQATQRRYFYGLTCDISTAPSLYCHSNTMRFSWDNTVRLDKSSDGWYTAIADDDAAILNDLFKSLADFAYSTLEHEYDELTSDTVVIECIRANEYQFYADGSVA